MHNFRFRLFPLGFFTALFNPDELCEIIREGCKGGFRLLRREFTIEMRRIFVIFAALGFGMIFRRDEKNPEPEYDYRIKLYKTRFFTRTADVGQMAQIINEGAQGGFELFFAVKYPTRFLLIFPRECYFFLFRKPYAGEKKNYSYSVCQTPYRFFTKTIDPEFYEKNLDDQGKSGKQLKLSFRDERRLFMIFKQNTSLAIFEKMS